MKINLSTLDQALTSVKKYKNIIVGFSGGIDSTVLLYGVCLLARKGLLRSNIKAIHVNHGLNDSCEEWESFCRRICSAYNVDLQVKNLEGLSEGLISIVKASCEQRGIASLNLLWIQIVFCYWRIIRMIK